MTDGTTTWMYNYDANGMRTSRSNGTTTYEYVYNGDSLVQMTVGSNTLYFANDTVLYNNTTYYYVKNLQGDVIAILNPSGAVVVQYTYDAWGNVLSTTGSMASTLGTLNPIRYRSYVYDSESGLYYLQSRYYDPEIGRFINADGFVSTGSLLGNNMFTYCNNNPVMRIDHNGQFSLEEWWNGISEGVGDFLEEAADEIEEAWDTVVDTYEDIYDTVGDGFETVTAAVSDFASDSWDFVVSYATDPVQTTKDVYDAFVTAPFWDTPGGRISKATLNGCVIGAIGRASTVAVVSLATAPPTGGISLTAIGVAAVEGAVEGAIVALLGALAHELYN